MEAVDGLVQDKVLQLGLGILLSQLAKNRPLTVSGLNFTLKIKKKKKKLCMGACVAWYTHTHQTTV